MKPKIIHILPHSDSLSHKKLEELNYLPRDYERVPYPPYWVGYWDTDWHVQVARETLKRTNKYELECWRPYDLADMVYSKEIDELI